MAISHSSSASTELRAATRTATRSPTNGTSGTGSPPDTTAIATHTYTTQGTFTATLRVDDGRGGVDTTSVRIDAGNNPPAPAISSPASSHRFYVGESIMLDGSATDPEDGALPATALTWEVIRHHDTHTHPFLPPTSGTGLQITAPAPEDISATTTTYLEIMLTATDSRGLSQTVSQEVRPRLVDLMFETAPPGLEARGRRQLDRRARDGHIVGGLAKSR